MAPVQVIGSTRAALGVPATVARIREALALAGLDAGPAPDARRSLVVDPAAWYAAAPAPPTHERLRRTIGYSLAPYGSARMQDDAEVGRSLGAIAHPDPHCAAHLARLGCRAVHVPLGCRPAPIDGGGARPVQVMTFGSASPRRLRAIAAGAGHVDDLPAAHLVFDGAGTTPFGPRPLSAAVVLADVADDDTLTVDLTVLLEAAEAGAAVVTDRLGPWPPGLEEAVAVVAPVETLLRHARELSEDPRAAAVHAAAAHAVLAAAAPLAAMGAALAELLAGDPPSGTRRTVVLSPFAAPRTPPTVTETLQADAERPDAAVRAGLQRALEAIKAVDARLARLESGGDGDAPTVERLRVAPPPDLAPLVSVVVPAHNASRTLVDTLESVRASAREPDSPPLEIVLVDDASPQGDAEVAADWAAHQDGLAITILRHSRNQGLSAARNTGVAHAAGEFVLPLDADNALRPFGLTRLLLALQGDPGATFAYGILERFSSGGTEGLVGLHPWAPERMRFGNYIDALSLLRRDRLLELGGYRDMAWGYEDWELWCRVAEAGGHGVWTPQIVARYRVRPGSMSSALHLSHLGPLADMLERHPELLT